MNPKEKALLSRPNFSDESEVRQGKTEKRGTKMSSPPPPPPALVLGSRKSDLAVWQAREVRRLLQGARAAPRLRALGYARAVAIETEGARGDAQTEAPLAALAAADPGIFTKELEVGLLAPRGAGAGGGGGAGGSGEDGGGEAVGGAAPASHAGRFVYDLAVHSLKDMPTRLPRGLLLAGVTRRDDPRDALVLSAARAAAAAAAAAAGAAPPRGLAGLPAGSVVGTSSVRREAALRRDFPHLEVRSVRGNLHTRLRKLDGLWTPADGNGNIGAGAGAGAVAGAAAGAAAPSPLQAAAADAAAANAAPAVTPPPPLPPPQQPQQQQQHYDALILAAAGLKRLGWGARASALLSPLDFPHCVGQGALGLEARAGDAAAQALARCASHGPSALRCLAERAFLARLEGGCQVPIGVHSYFDGGLLDDDSAGQDLGGAGSGSGSAAGAARSPAASAPAPAARRGGAPPDADGAPAAPERVRTLTLHGTVTAPDGGRSVTGSVSEAVLVPDTDGDGLDDGPDGLGGGYEAEAEAGAGAGDAAQQGAVITAAQWARMCEDGARVGQALAAALLRAGAADILGAQWAARAAPASAPAPAPGDAAAEAGAGPESAGPRALTYGAAEEALDR